MKKLMLIVNPNAGRGGYKTGLGEALHIFYTSGWLPEVYFTAGPGDATRLVRQYARNYDLLVCMGGDGTLSETAAGLAQCPGAPELGYLPMGTANDMAASLGLSATQRRPPRPSSPAGPWIWTWACSILTAILPMWPPSAPLRT